uniref:TNFRSF11A n=1 Tax=Lepidosiren paradoxus TaxID=7883 RepID=A0A6G6CWA2_LEPPA|nr:TNFRSF11A [Lepidosiren paradoxa]QIE07175.1 TNFRSF21 [Lepidosiren paradoxa]
MLALVVRTFSLEMPTAFSRALGGVSVFFKASTCGLKTMIFWRLLVFILFSTAAFRTCSEAAEESHSGQYRHYNPLTRKDLMCYKCPAGTHVSKHCTETTLRECTQCPAGSFTSQENGLLKCLTCSPPCKEPMIEKVHCTALSDRKCTCPPGTFFSNKTCVPHTVCPVGWGVRKKGSETEDTRCKPCPHGTFSDVPSSVMRCKSHSNCLKQGQVLIMEGTREHNSVCGLTISSEKATSLSASSLPADHTSDVPFTSVSQETDHSDLEFWSPDILTKEEMSTEVLNEMSTTQPSSESLPPLRPQVSEQPARKSPHHHHQHRTLSQTAPTKLDPATRTGAQSKNTSFKPSRRGTPNSFKHFDINEHLPWMIVLFLLLVLVIIVVCSIRRSSRVLKKGPKQDLNSIVEKAAVKKRPSFQNKEKWMYYSNGHGIDILKLVAAQVGSQWKDIYQFLTTASEQDITSFSSGYTSDHERAYAALLHWTIQDPEANLVKLINALHQYRRIDVVEKIRAVMEDTHQCNIDTLAIPANHNPAAPNSKPLGPATLTVERSPLDKTKGFFADESEPLLRSDSTSSGSSALSRTGSFITKEKKDTVLRQVRLDPCDLQPIFDDMLHILNRDELHVIEEIPQAEDKLDRLFEIAGVKSQEASQKLLDSVYSHLPDLL